MSQENKIEAENLSQTTDFLPSDGASCSALQRALDDGQEVKIFKLMGSGLGYCVVIHGDCYVEARSRDTLDQAVTDAAKLYQEWFDETE